MMQQWNKADKMFPFGYIFTDEYGFISTNELKKLNPEVLSLILTKPYHEVEGGLIEKIIWYPNGNMDRYYTKSVFPYEPIGGYPLFNFYGQKIYNDFLNNKNKEDKI